MTRTRWRNFFYSLVDEAKNEKNENKIIDMKMKYLPYQKIDKFFLSASYGEEYIPTFNEKSSIIFIW